LVAGMKSSNCAASSFASCSIVLGFANDGSIPGFRAPFSIQDLWILAGAVDRFNHFRVYYKQTNSSETGQ
jgi:hypothetical protein